jgi:putative zinc finger/helix-turn-helix YgiT family protein
MAILKSEARLCLNCMEEHQVDIVEVTEQETFKGVNVEFTAIYEFCSNTDNYLETEDMIRANSLAVKDAYRKKVGLMTSAEIRAMRKKYDVSQKDFSEILDWGGATITRYENHHVQDRAHDDILRKIDSDPKWFLEMLKRAEARLSTKAFNLYYHKACELYNKKKNQYLIDSIHAIYATFEGEAVTGGVELDLDKVVEIINYLALQVVALHKVKLMKMLWYSDELNFKRHGKAITGLVYEAWPKGALPVGHDQIILLENVCFETVEYGENVGYKFKPIQGFEGKYLTDQEIETMDEIVKQLGKLNTDEIVDRMHDEEAYKQTPIYSIINYSFASKLSLN